MIYFVLYYSETSDRISLRWSNEFSVSPLFSFAFFLFSCFFFFFSVLFFCCICTAFVCVDLTSQWALFLFIALSSCLFFYVQNIFIVAVIFQWQNRLIWTMLNIKGKAKEILSTHGRLGNCIKQIQIHYTMRREHSQETVCTLFARYEKEEDENHISISLSFGFISSPTHVSFNVIIIIITTIYNLADLFVGSFVRLSRLIQTHSLCSVLYQIKYRFSLFCSCCFFLHFEVVSLYFIL